MRTYWNVKLSQQEVDTRTEVTLKTANVTGQSTDAVSEQLTAVWNGYKVNSAEAELYIDKLAAVAATTASDLEELSTGMSRVASAANLMGVDVDQLNAQLATIVSVTREAPETIGTSLKTVYARMGDIEAGLDGEVSLDEYTQQMADMGVHVLDNNGKLRDMGDVIEEVGERWGSMSREQQVALTQTMAGTRQYSRLMSLFDNWDMYEEALNTSANAAGTLQEQQDIYMESTAAHLAKAQAAAEDLYDSLLDNDTINFFADLSAGVLDFSANFIDAIGGGEEALLGFGSLFTNIFSKQISHSIATTITNFQNLKNNLEQRSAEISVVNLFDGIENINNTKTQEIIDMKKEQLKYESVLTAEAENYGNELIKQKNTIANHIDLLNEKKEVAFEKAERQTGIQYNGNKDAAIKDLDESVIAIDDSLKTRTAGKTINQLSINLKEAEKDVEKLTKVKKDLINESKLYVDNIKEELKKHRLEKNSLKDLEEEYKKLKEIIAQVDNGEEVSAEKIRNALKDLDIANVKALKATSQELKIASQELKNYENNIKNADEASKNIDLANKDFVKRLALENAINGVVQLTSALGSLGSVWTTISNLGNIISNDNLTTSEKFTQIMMGLTSIITMSISGINSLKKSYDTLKSGATSLLIAEKTKQALQKQGISLSIIDLLSLKKKTEAEQMEYLMTVKGMTAEQAKIVVDKLSIASNTVHATTVLSVVGAYAALLVTLLPYIAIAGTIALAIFGIVKAFNAENEAIKKQEKAVDALTNAHKKLVQQQEELKSGVSEYQKAQEELEKCTRGTEEWSEKLLEVNNIVLDLIKKFPELAEYLTIGENGELGLGEEGIKKEQEKSRQKVIASSAGATTANIKEQQMKNDKEFNDFLKKNKTSKYYQTFNGAEYAKGQRSLSKEETDDIVDKLGLEKIQQIAAGKITDYENLGLDKSQFEFLKKYGDELVSLYIERNNIEKQNNANLQGLASSILGTNEKFKKLPEDIQSTVSALSDTKLEKLIEDKKTEEKYSKNDYLLTQAKEMHGQDQVQTQGGQFQMKNEEGKWTNVSKEEIQNQVINYDIQVNGELYDQDIINAAKGLQKYDKATVNALTGANGQEAIDFSKISEEEAAKIEVNKSELSQKYAEFGYDTAEAFLNAINAGLDGRKEQIKNNYVKLITDTSEEQGVSQDKLQEYLSQEEYEKLINEGFDPTEILGQIDWSKILNKEDFNKELEKIKKDVKAIDISGIAKNFNLNQDDLEATAEYIMKNAEASDELADRLKDDKKAAIEAATAMLRFDRAVEDVTNNYEKWNKTLKEGNITDKAKAIGELRESYADLLNIDGSKLSDTFLESTDNLNLMKKAIEGDKDAYQQLRIELAKENNVKLNFETEEAKNDYYNLLQEFGQQDFTVEAKLEDTQYAEKLYEMMVNAGLTADRIQDKFNDLGWDVQVDQVPITVSEQDVKNGSISVPEFTTMDFAGMSIPMVSNIRQIPISADMEAGSTVNMPIFKRNGKNITGTYKGNPKPSASSKAKAGGSGKKGGGGGGGSSKSKPQKKDPIKSQIDRYHDVNLELKKLENNLEDISREQDKLFGKDLIDNLNKELKILEKQRDVLQQKMEIAKAEAAELKTSLGSQGVTFDSEGDISNYASLLKSKEDYLNSLIARYNSMSAEEQEAFEETIEKAQEDLDKLKEDIERYDELITDEIPGISDEIQDALDREFEIKIEKFRMNIDITMDMNDLTQKWLDFKKEVIDGISEEDMLGNAMASLDKLKSLDNPIKALTDQLNAEIGEFKEVFNGGSDIYGNNQQQSLENSKETLEQLMDMLMEQQELVKEIREYQLDGIDQAIEKFDKHIEQYETINDMLEHDMNLIELLYGEDAYDAMDKYYDKMSENNLEQMEALRMNRDDYQKRYYEEAELAKQLRQQEAAAAASGNKELEVQYRQAAEHHEKLSEKWYESWISASQDLNAIVEQETENIINKYANTVNKVFDELTKKMTGGRQLDFLSEEWDLVTQNADRYLDTINEMYALQELENKYLNAINDTDSLKAQKDLNNLMNDQLDMLREKDKLTEADIERANMMYDIALKQIALEEAQKNKSQMRLRRDSQGNYSYQFVSDEDAIAEAQKELAAAQNELYNFDKEQYRNNLSEVLNIFGEYKDRLTELMADTTLTFEEKEEQKAILAEQYQTLITGYVEENEWLRLNLKESAFAEMANLYQTDVENFRQMSEEEQEELMSNLVPEWDSAIQTMTDRFVVDFIPACDEAFKQLSAATLEYEEDLKKVEETAQISFQEIQEGYNATTEAVQGLMSSNEELYQQYQSQIEAMERIEQLLINQLQQYKDITAEAKRASKAAYDVIQAQIDLEKHEAEKAAKEAAIEMGEQIEWSILGPDGVPKPDSRGAGGQYTVKKGDNLWKLAKQRTGDGTRWKEIYNMNQELIESTAKRYGYSDSGGGHWIFPGTVLTMPFDTGGYTGDWSGDGRLAMLHQKELVLNAEDTQNILSAVSIVRNIDALLSSLNASMLSNLNSSFGSFGLNNETFEQNVHIEANFPNVVNRAEIEEAFNNLTNIASQRAYNNKR